MLKINLRKRICLLVVFAFFMLVRIGVSAGNEPLKDVTQEGVDFLSEVPVETTVYAAGNGTVTYEPAQNGQNAVITLKDATINGQQTANYQGVNSASAAILASGNIDLELVGENKISVSKQYAYGLFFFNGNVSIKGSGSLTIDVLTPLNGGSGIKILNGRDATEDMGNFTLSDGSVTINMQKGDVSYCLSAGSDVTVEDGALMIKGGSCSVISMSGDINIRNAYVSCEEFDDSGLFTYDGNVCVDGENTVLNISALKDEPYTIGIYTGSESGIPAVSIESGTVDISAGQGGIYVDGGGDITVAGGHVLSKAQNDSSDIDAVGLWATGKVSIIDGIVEASGISNFGIGIYSDTSIVVTGGDVTAKGTKQAVSHVPDTSAYEDPIIKAASDFDGEFQEDFSAEKLAAYRFFNITDRVIQYEIQYENGQAMIMAPKASDAVVVFAAYDDIGILTDLEVKEVSLSEGRNVIESVSFAPDEGTGKLILLDSMSNMAPLCKTEAFELSVQ